MSIESGGEHATVRVMNSGSPILEEERVRIFERFYRCSETRRQTPGSGLGLYFAHKIICAHGRQRRTEAASTVSDKKTVFRLTLPLARSEMLTS